MYPKWHEVKRRDYAADVKAAAERLQARGVYPTGVAVWAEVGGGTRYRVGQVLAALIERGELVVTVPRPKGCRPNADGGNRR